MDSPYHDHEIQWALERLPLVEHENFLMFDDVELLEYTRLLQREVRALRALTHAGIQEIHHLTRELEQQRRQNARLRDELRCQQQAAA